MTSNDKPAEAQRLQAWNKTAGELSDHSDRAPVTGDEATQRRNDEQAARESRLTLEQVRRRRALTRDKARADSQAFEGQAVLSRAGPMLADDPDCGVLTYCDYTLYAFYSIQILPKKPGSTTNPPGFS